jgi:prepilin-type N-terminal cleavage/methylation domain-containing protein
MTRRRAGARGFTLVEVLVGLLILTLIVTTSLAVFYDHARRVRQAEEIVVVWQAISNEAEILRFRPWQALQPGHSHPFDGDLSILAHLRDVTTSVEIDQQEPHVKAVSLTVEWGEGRRAEATVVRTDTGGSNLW